MVFTLCAIGSNKKFQMNYVNTTNATYGGQFISFDKTQDFITTLQSHTDLNVSFLAKPPPDRYVQYLNMQAPPPKNNNNQKPACYTGGV